MRPQNTQTQQEGAETFSSRRRVTWNDNSSSLRSSLDPPKLSDIRSKRGSLDPLDPPYVETSPVSQQRCKSRNVYAQMSPRNPMLVTNTHYNMYEANVNSRWMQAFGVTHTHTHTHTLNIHIAQATSTRHLGATICSDTHSTKSYLAW
jgi:hypothetical protein